MEGYLTAAYCSLAYLQVIPPTNLFYDDHTVNITIGDSFVNNPTYDGEAVTSWSISPPVPAGVTFNTSTGVITVSSNSIIISTQYIVTASNAGGSTSNFVSIKVNDYPPTNLSYSSSSVTYVPNVAITANTPTISGGEVTQYGISPALPQGLSINYYTGVISGTPTTTTPATNYTVTATNTVVIGEPVDFVVWNRPIVTLRAQIDSTSPAERVERPGRVPGEAGRLPEKC